MYLIMGGVAFPRFSPHQNSGKLFTEKSILFLMWPEAEDLEYFLGFGVKIMPLLVPPSIKKSQWPLIYFYIPCFLFSALFSSSVLEPLSF